MIHFNTYIPERIKKGNAIYEMIFGAGVKTESFDWLKYLPDRERQWWLPFCVAFSRLDCAEAVARKAGKTLDFSDRRLAVESGTSKRGNTLDAVSDCFRKNGVDKEEDTPLTAKMIADGWNAWEAINKLPRAGERYFGGSHSWVLSKAAMIDALDHSPLQIAVGETDANWERDGEVQNPTKIDYYHAVVLYFIDADGRYYVRDTIGKEFKILNKNYPIGWCKSFRDLPENWKDAMNTFVKIIKDKNSPSVGFWMPAINESALETLALGFNKPIEKKSDGAIDWDKTIEGELELKNN
ncbi:MAG: hypothetical protein WC445_01190 [Patescibacteria group bacterium]